MTSLNKQRGSEMKTIKSLILSTVVIAISSAVGAQGMDPSMMQQYPGGMTPQQIQQMQQQRMQNGMPMGDPGTMPMYQQNMPMMDSQRNQMMMDPVMRKNMMQYRQACMSGQGGMMHHQMMQHMTQMEQRLDKIEAMLAELIKLQKSK